MPAPEDPAQGSPSAARVRAYDRGRTRPSSSPVKELERQLVILTGLSNFGDSSNPLDGSRVFLLPGDLSRLHEMSSRQAAEMGIARTLLVGFGFYLFSYTVCLRGFLTRLSFSRFYSSNSIYVMRR